MQEKHRKVLQTHKKFLIKNIVWTDELEAQLKTFALVTDSTLRDIKEKKNRDDKVAILLEQLPLRGSNAYQNFYDVLQLSGHYCVADFLREEDAVLAKYNAKEMYQKLKFLEKLKDQERKELEEFFVDKFRDESLRMVWKDDFREKAKALDAKRDQLDQHFAYEKLKKKSEEELESLGKKLRNEKEEATVLRATINQLKHEYKDLEAKRFKESGAQLRYTQANENVLNRKTQRLELAEKTLREVNKKMSKVINLRPRPETEQDEMDLANYEFAFVCEDLDTLMDSYEDLLMVRRKYRELMNEKEYVLTHMGHDVQGEGKDIALTDAYRDFVAENDEKLLEMKSQMESFQHLIDEQKEKIDSMSKDKDEAKNKFQMGATVWQSAIMNVMRNQLQDVKKENRIKDTRIQMYEGEMMKLRNRVNDLERERDRMIKNAVQEKKQLKVAIEANGNQSVSTHSSPRGDDELETISELKGDSSNSNVYSHAHSSKKSTVLPPLRQALLQSEMMPGSPVPATKSNKARPLGAVGKSSNKYLALPDGLTTAPVRLENRKYNTLPPGLGDLKALHSQGGKSKFDKAIAPPPMSKVSLKGM